ncbi:hypothetical protein EJB05_16491, partial [Eragrostis curvula]
MHDCYFGHSKRRVEIYRIEAPPRTAEGSGFCPRSPPEKVAECAIENIVFPLYLVECDSELVLVGYTDVSRTDMVIYKLADLANGEAIPMTSIRGHAFFLGEHSVCVSAGEGFPSILGDSIHITGFRRGSRRREKIQMLACDTQHGSGVWSPVSKGGTIASPYRNPFTLIHHLYSCCFRCYWSRGLIYGTRKGEAVRQLHY